MKGTQTPPRQIKTPSLPLPLLCVDHLFPSLWEVITIIPIFQMRRLTHKKDKLTCHSHTAKEVCGMELSPEPRAVCCGHLKRKEAHLKSLGL